MRKSLFAIWTILGMLCARSAVAQTKEPELRFKITTSQGVMEGKLFYKEVPNTVANFVTLARQGFYNGLLFHRVIPQFMVQTGDPKGTGMGGPGYAFADEFSPSLKHSKAGILSMANSGPDTNGSQFFITVAATPHLDQRHTVFGEVLSGADVAIKISLLKSDPASNRPVQDIKMDKVEIIGDWYKAPAIVKVEKASDKDIEAATRKSADAVATKLGEALDLGKLDQLEYQNSQTKGAMVQVVYRARFAKDKGTTIILMGELKGGFTVHQIQYSRGPQNH